MGTRVLSFTITGGESSVTDVEPTYTLGLFMVKIIILPFDITTTCLIRSFHSTLAPRDSIITLTGTIVLLFIIIGFTSDSVILPLMTSVISSEAALHCNIAENKNKKQIRKNAIFFSNFLSSLS